MPTNEYFLNQVANQQQVLMTVESHTMNVGLHSGIKLQSSVELQTEVEAHSDFDISVHKRNFKSPNREVHRGSKVEKPNEEYREKTRLSKYVKRHHPTAQIIGVKDVRPMTRNKLRSDTCFLGMHEPKIVKKILRR